MLHADYCKLVEYPSFRLSEVLLVDNTALRQTTQGHSLCLGSDRISHHQPLQSSNLLLQMIQSSVNHSQGRGVCLQDGVLP